jgi:hypothetical protein
MGWEIVDYVVLRLSSSPSPANGSDLTIQCPQVPVDYVWLVTGIAVECPTSESVSCVIYDLDPASNAVPCAGTRAGNFDIDDGATLIIPGGSVLSFVWIGVDIGITAKCRVQYELAQRTGTAAKRPILT